MPSTVPPDAFVLEIEFAGINLFVRQKETLEATANRGLKVLMPDARLRRPNDPAMKHLDDKPAIPHVAYVRFNMANLPSVGTELDHVVNDRGPSFEVVHRLNGESISFEGLTPKQPVNTDGLEVPDFNEFAAKLELREDLDKSNKIVASTELSGGVIESFSVAGQTWSLSGELGSNGPIEEREFGGMVVWTSAPIVGDGLDLVLKSFDDTQTTRIPLTAKKTKDGSTRRIAIKIANLCDKNPLEWDELPQRTVAEDDVDFKWLYKLLQLRAKKNGSNVPDVLPIPKPVSTRTEGGLMDCLPGVIDEPGH